jgi:hypothetical protein
VKMRSFKSFLCYKKSIKDLENQSFNIVIILFGDF